MISKGQEEKAAGISDKKAIQHRNLTLVKAKGFESIPECSLFDGTNQMTFMTVSSTNPNYYIVNRYSKGIVYFNNEKKIQKEFDLRFSKKHIKKDLSIFSIIHAIPLIFLSSPLFKSFISFETSQKFIFFLRKFLIFFFSR